MLTQGLGARGAGDNCKISPSPCCFVQWEIVYDFGQVPRAQFDHQVRPDYRNICFINYQHVVQQKWNNWDKLKQRWSKTQKRQLEEGLQAARYRRRARAEWEPTACRRASSRRERGAARLGWDSRTWGILGSLNEGPSRDRAWRRFDGWGMLRPRCKEGQWAEGPSIAITAIFFLEFAYLFRLSVSIRKVASEYLFCVLTCINFYIFHMYFIFMYCLVKRIFNISFYMLAVIIGRHTWSGQICTHIHTKIHTQTHKKR